MKLIEDDKRRRKVWTITVSIVAGLTAAVVLLLALWQSAPFGPQQSESTLGTQPSLPAKSGQSNQPKWEQVSRAYRVQGTITNIVAENGKLKSITLQATKNMACCNNPVDYDFAGKTLEVYFEDAAVDTKTLNKLQKGTEIVITIAQFAVSDGKVVYGALPEWLYFAVNGTYLDLQGKITSEEDLRP